ncbi:hypothetical protein AKJ40_03755, partial [candidate division MSBL1 archaeon SCGC-AAA259M10]
MIATFVFSAFLVYFAYIQTKLIKREQKSPEWEIKNLKVVVQSEEYQDEYLVNFDIENVGEGRGESLIFITPPKIRNLLFKKKRFYVLISEMHSLPYRGL